MERKGGGVEKRRWTVREGVDRKEKEVCRER